MSDFEQVQFQGRYSSLDANNLNCFKYQRRPALAKIPMNFSQLNQVNLQQIIRCRRNAIISKYYFKIMK